MIQPSQFTLISILSLSFLSLAPDSKCGAEYVAQSTAKCVPDKCIAPITKAQEGDKGKCYYVYMYSILLATWIIYRVSLCGWAKHWWTPIFNSCHWFAQKQRDLLW